MEYIRESNPLKIFLNAKQRIPATKAHGEMANSKVFAYRKNIKLAFL